MLFLVILIERIIVIIAKIKAALAPFKIVKKEIKINKYCPKSNFHIFYKKANPNKQ